MDVTIKRTQDAKTAYQIAENLPHYFDEHGLSKIKKAVAHEFLFGAYIGNRMVGFLTFKELDPQAIELSWIGILSDFQGKGVGSKLFLDSLKEMGNKYKLCEVKTLSDMVIDEGYSKTRNFYRRLGFIPLETISPYPGWDPNSPCLVMVKPLK